MSRLRRRRWPVIAIVIGVLGLLAWYVLYTQQVVTSLRREATVQARMYARIYEALQDTSATADPTVALFDLSRAIRESGLPIVVTDPSGRVTASANVPEDITRDTAAMRAFVAQLDKRNPAIVEPAIGAVHLGDSQVVSGLRTIPALQAVGIVLLVGFGIYALVERGRAEREKVWAGMAREAAHQLGTPLSAMAGWLELLEDSVTGATPTRAVAAMQQDVQRLERVSHRFERIGRPPRRDDVDCNGMVDRIAEYFALRAPTLARTVRIRSEHPEEAVTVPGDTVLLEWVLEVLVKNAMDALGGKNGEVVISSRSEPEGVRIRVQDDGPGVPKHLRRRIFDAGFSTKDRGWGIGLSLARRIVEEHHGGQLLLADTDRGAAFDIILRG